MRDDDSISNPSNNASFDEVCQARRRLLKGSAGAAALTLFGTPMMISRNAQAAQPPGSAPGVQPTFTSVPVSRADTVVVPSGYSAQVLVAWGDPVSNGPAFKQDASNTTADQEQQWGMHNDGMHFFPLYDTGPGGLPIPSSTRGLLVANHEYTDAGLLFPDGMVTWTADKVKKAQAAHGVGVVEVRMVGTTWQVVRPSPWARRITANTPCLFSGPAAGSALLKTALESTGTVVLGTLNNCSHGVTPWGTFLTGEENFNGYFRNGSTTEHTRYGVAAADFGYRWAEFDERFDAAKHPNEPNRFGWVVEFDPYDPTSIPVKRTALGRIKHEGATVTVANDGRVVAYMGDDERFEYVYKFVSNGRFNPDARDANRNLLDDGTLYVARFDANGTGVWLALVQGQNGLTAANGFATQADILVKTRQAADRAGATKMDRPEWIAVNPHNKDVYCTLTNNSQRGAAGRAAVDAANPRASNVYGHIIRWAEAGGDPAGLTFEWNIFVQAGDPASSDPNKRGNINGDKFGSPDGLWFDERGLLWIQTDVSTSVLNTGDYANIGNNQMLAANVATGEIRRFLVGPNGCEITGVVSTPDHRTLFVGIQHPGEPASELSDPKNPKAVSSWPDGAAGGRPRAAVVAIRRNDGGIIGT